MINKRYLHMSLLGLATLTLVACGETPLDAPVDQSLTEAELAVEPPAEQIPAEQLPTTNDASVNVTANAGASNPAPFDLETSYPTPLPQESPVSPTKRKRKPSAPIKKLPKDDFRTVDWTDLMPQEDIDALRNPPSYITEIEEGSSADSLSDVMQNNSEIDPDDPYQLALKSAKIIPTLNGQAVRIPGFVVPLEFDDQQLITQFFLVPFFGACIHVPPPPPNQIIFVDAPEGFRPRALFDPFWISGIIKTDTIQNDIATAAYTMQMHHIERYTEE